jgi:predicted glycosyltransferase
VPPIVFYCQFRHSLGHYARTRLIAERVAQAGGETFLIFGGRRPPGLQVHPALEVLPLPDLQGSLTDSKLVAQRATLIREQLDRLRPRRVLVDYMPLGLAGELMESLLETSAETEFCWGMPYPGAVRSAPGNPRVRRALARYARAFVYTSAGFLDPVDSYRAYGLPKQVHHLGAVVPRPLVSDAQSSATLASGPQPGAPILPPLVVGLAGAGVGAETVLRLLLRRAAPLAARGEIRLRLVAGVFHEAAPLVEQARGLPNVEVLEQGGAEKCSRDAAVVVGRCGYNTAFSLAQTSLPLVFLPWPSPDPGYTEQYDRARALSTLPGIRWVDERDPQAEERLAAALEEALREGRRARTLPFETTGAEAAARILLERP